MLSIKETTESDKRAGLISFHNLTFRLILASGGIFFLLAFFISPGKRAANVETAPQATRTGSFETLTGEKAVAKLKETGDYDALEKAAVAVQYKIEPVAGNSAKFRAANPAQNLAATFDSAGARLQTIKAENSSAIPAQIPAQISWQLASFGYGENQTAVAAGEIRAAGQRVEIRRDAQSLTEWFENKPAGIEQGFTLGERPAKNAQGENLRLTLKTAGLKNLNVSADGQAVELMSGEESFYYAGLKVWDAAGKTLEAKMRQEKAGEIWLEVEENEAVYPLTIDPTFAQTAKLTASDAAASDQFGKSVAINGNTAIVGSFLDNATFQNQGSAYVFVRSANGIWTQQQKLTAADGATDDYFGYSVAVSGDLAVVGASGDDGNSVDEGSAYIFKRTGSVWTQVTKITANDAAADARFGYSVGYTGGRIVVGAPFQTITQQKQGAAYVFDFRNNAWTQQGKLIAADAAANSQFGYSVAIDADTAVVGAPQADGNVQDQGAAYVFTIINGSWGQKQKLALTLPATGDLFGYCVDVSVNSIIVGAPGDDESFSNQGSAAIFVPNGNILTMQQKLLASDAQADDKFGASVALSGTLALVGASDDNLSGANQGSAYVFAFSNGNWSKTDKLHATDGADDDKFGTSVALSGNTAIVGAQFDNDAFSDQGSARIFRLLSPTWNQQKITTSDGAAHDYVGTSIAISGETAVVGAVNAAGNVDGQGAAYIFTRNSNGSWIFQQKVFSADGNYLDDFGNSVAIDGNTIVVGDDGAQANDDNLGAAYVYVRTNNTWNLQQKLIAADAVYGDGGFGQSVGISGDTIVIGSNNDTHAASGIAQEGSAYVFVRSGNVWSQQQKLIASDAHQYDEFGTSVDIEGDTIVVGVPLEGDDASQSTSHKGAAYVFVRSGGVWTQQQKIIASDRQNGDLFGNSVAISGETLVCGAPGADNNGAPQGTAYVFVRNGNLWSLQKKIYSPSAPSPNGFNQSFGGRVAIDGDTIAIGASAEFVNSIQSGAAYIFMRSGTSWSTGHRLTTGDGTGDSYFGGSLAVSGDKVAVGAPRVWQPNPFQGAVYIHTNNLAPTAAEAVVSGRVMTAKGNGIVNARVMLTGGNLTEPRYAQTTTNGNYRFENVPVGEGYIVEVFSKRFPFSNPALFLNVTGDIDTADFISD